LLLSCFFNGFIALYFGKGIKGADFFADEGLLANDNLDLADILCNFLDCFAVWLSETVVFSMSASKESDLLSVPWTCEAVIALDLRTLKGESEDEGFLEKSVAVVAAVDGNFLEEETETVPGFPSGEAYFRGEESSAFKLLMSSWGTPDYCRNSVLGFVFISENEFGRFFRNATFIHFLAILSIPGETASR